MHPDLQQIIRELKKETCPPGVTDKVRAQISAGQFSPRRPRFILRLATACLILVCCLSLWRWHTTEVARQRAELAELNSRQRAQVATQVEDALGLVGSVLLDAGTQSGKIISDRTVPPLRSSLDITKIKITQYLNL